jgi:PPOX class probable F420-dependent enzyme
MHQPTLLIKNLSDTAPRGPGRGSPPFAGMLPPRPMSSSRLVRQLGMESKNLADLYGLPLLEWARIESRLDKGVHLAPQSGGPSRHTSWLATINEDGSPHVTAVGALWVDGAFWFETGARTRKGQNLARDPRCTLSLATEEFDLVLEGRAATVTDPSTVAAMAARWNDSGWPARVDETGQALTADFSAPSAGSPPWTVYRITPDRATALETVEPGGATRWSFSEQ